MSEPAGAAAAPLRVLLVDDEPLARARLRALVEASTAPRAQVVGEAGDIEQALQRVQDTPCDLLLLDIVMPGGSGLRLADLLRRQAGAPAVVFVSAHGEHALSAFEVEALDYLTKPVRRDRLQAALARAAQRRPPPAAAADPAPPPAPPVLVVSDRGRVLRIPLDEVLYLRAGDKYVTLCSQRGEWTLDESLAELEPRLGPGFLRVHRNAVVALSAVRLLTRRDDGDGGEGWQLQLANGDWLAVSRRQLAAVREALAAAGR